MDKVKEIFYSPSEGFSNFGELWRKVKEKKINVTYKQVKEFYESQAVNQVYKVPNNKNYKPIVNPFNSVGCLQMDLMDINKFFRENGHHTFILCVVDVWSRYAWAFPLKSKEAKVFASHLETVIKDIQVKYPNNVLMVTSDNGNEFKGQEKTLVKKYHIHQFLNDPHSVIAKTQMGIIERFNRTLWNKIKKYMSATDSLSFVDKIGSFVQNYNNSYHMSIKMKPLSVFNGEKIPVVVPVQEEPKSLFEIGDKVRTIVNTKKFDKRSFVQRWSEKIYTIVEKKGNRFVLEDREGKRLGKTYLDRELNKANKSEKPTNLQPAIKSNTKVNTFVKKKQRQDLDNVNKETGEVKVDKRLIPANNKKVHKPVQRVDDMPKESHGRKPDINKDNPVGKRVSIYWDGDKQWYKGVVKDKSKEDGI
jgi:hypothetical protein